MLNPHDIETWYVEYMQDLPRFVPDGIVDIDLPLLEDLGLVSYEDTTEDEEEADEGLLSHSFYVIESSEKLTLFNTEFVVWIVPKLIEQIPCTYTLIAINDLKKPHLEMVFKTNGAFNHSGLILRILEKFLDEIKENEKEMVKIRENI
jgi:hypothetical protein